MKKIFFVCVVMLFQVVHSDTESLDAVKEILFDRMEIAATNHFEFKVESKTIDNKRKQRISVKTDGVD